MQLFTEQVFSCELQLLFNTLHYAKIFENERKFFAHVADIEEPAQPVQQKLSDFIEKILISYKNHGNWFQVPGTHPLVMGGQHAKSSPKYDKHNNTVRELLENEYVKEGLISRYQSGETGEYFIAGKILLKTNVHSLFLLLPDGDYIRIELNGDEFTEFRDIEIEDISLHDIFLTCFQTD